MKPLTALVTLTILMLPGCGSMPTEMSSGTGTEVVGQAVYPNSLLLPSDPVRPVVHGKVFMFPLGRFPDTGWAFADPAPTAVTDSGGFFIIQSMPADSYIIEIVGDSAMAIAQRVVVNGGDRRADVGRLVVLRTAVIQSLVSFRLPSILGIRYYLGIYGTHHIVCGGANDTAIGLTGVPAGVGFRVSVTIVNPISMAFDFFDVHVLPDSTTFLQPVTIGF